MKDYNPMKDINSINNEVKGTKPKEDPSQAAINSIQGGEDLKEQKSTSDKPDLISTDPDLQAEYDEWKRTHDTANWQYQFGSPHTDYQAYKDINEAKLQHEIGVQASTIHGGPGEELMEAIDTTLKAHNASKETKETPEDEYFREKFGPKPYTTDAYPKKEEE